MNSQETTRSLTRLVRQSRIPTLCWSAGFNISVSTYHGRQDVEIRSGAFGNTAPGIRRPRELLSANIITKRTEYAPLGAYELVTIVLN